MVTPRTNRKALDLARRLENAAPQIQTSLEHITEQIAYADGHAAATLGDGGSRGNQDLTRVEAAAERRWQLAADRAQIYDDLQALDDIFTSMMKVARYAQGVRLAPQSKPRCYTDPGLEGYYIPRDEGGWSDPACTNIPRASAGLCDACYKRMTRWRRDHDLKPIGEHIPAA